MKKILPIIAILLLSTSLALAQEANPSELSLTAIPPRLELEALPGATLQETVKFRNESETEMVVSVVTQDFIVNDNQGTPIAVSEAVSGRWSLAGWINATPKQLVIAPGEITTIDLVLVIPDDALPGGHYAMVTYAPVSESSLGGNEGIGGGSEIIPKVGSLIYLNVIGDVIEAANLKSFSVEQKFAHYGPIKLSTEIENLGDAHFSPQGIVTVSNLLSDPVAAFELEEKNIFPFASRTYDFEVEGKWRFGRYQAQLAATAGSSQVPLKGLIYFWIVPVKELAVVGLSLVVIIALVTRRKAKKGQDQENLSPEEPTIETPVG